MTYFQQSRDFSFLRSGSKGYWDPGLCIVQTRVQKGLKRGSQGEEQVVFVKITAIFELKM